jgi:ferric-dicitrate binding protein FerR (iron transport regulator)
VIGQGRGACPSELALSRAFTIGAETPLRLHVEGCERCRRRWRELQELRQLVRALPVADLPEPTRESVREAVILGGRPGPERAAWHRSLTFALGALATGTLVLLAVGGPSAFRRPVVPTELPPQNGRVATLGPAQFALIGARPDEIVRLEEGTISVEVKRLGPGERFRVRTGDAEVEVRGTAFEVTALGDRLAGVRVLHGRVEVRPAGRAPSLLQVGQSWAPASAPASAARIVESALPAPQRVPGPVARAVARTPLPPVDRAAAPVRNPRPGPVRIASITAPVSIRNLPPAVAAPAPAVPVERRRTHGSPAEEHFRNAWAALGGRDPAVALGELDAAESSGGAGPILEDIHYWRAVSLQRQGRRQEAGLAYAEFLQRHPDSARAREASVALGWIWLSMGRKEAARARFNAALDDPSPRVRQSASAGLSAAAATGAGSPN